MVFCPLVYRCGVHGTKLYSSYVPPTLLESHAIMHTTYQQGTLKSNAASVTVWGVCWCDMRPLIRFESILINAKCVSILSDRQNSSRQILLYDGFRKLLQHNVTPHTSRIATNWIQKHPSKCRLFH